MQDIWIGPHVADSAPIPSEVQRPCFLQWISNFDPSAHRTISHFASVHFLISFVRDDGISGSFSHITYSLHGRALTCICGWHTHNDFLLFLAYAVIKKNHCIGSLFLIECWGPEDHERPVLRFFFLFPIGEPMHIFTSEENCVSKMLSICIQSCYWSVAS